MSEEPRLAPSHSGSVVLDLGGNVGALMVHVGSEMAGAEIGITPTDPASGTPHTHTDVRERHIGAAIMYAAVFPSLVAGDYLLEDPRGGTSKPVTVSGGRVAQLDWRAAPSDAPSEAPQ
ncbi:MAG: phospholipase [Acidimicrobiales bacterium]